MPLDRREIAAIKNSNAYFHGIITQGNYVSNFYESIDQKSREKGWTIFQTFSDFIGYISQQKEKAINARVEKDYLTIFSDLVTEVFHDQKIQQNLKPAEKTKLNDYIKQLKEANTSEKIESLQDNLGNAIQNSQNTTPAFGASAREQQPRPVSFGAKVVYNGGTTPVPGEPLPPVPIPSPVPPQPPLADVANHNITVEKGKNNENTIFKRWFGEIDSNPEDSTSTYHISAVDTAKYDNDEGLRSKLESIKDAKKEGGVLKFNSENAKKESVFQYLFLRHHHLVPNLANPDGLQAPVYDELGFSEFEPVNTVDIAVTKKAGQDNKYRLDIVFNTGNAGKECVAHADYGNTRMEIICDDKGQVRTQFVTRDLNRDGIREIKDFNEIPQTEQAFFNNLEITWKIFNAREPENTTQMEGASAGIGNNVQPWTGAQIINGNYGHNVLGLGGRGHEPTPQPPAPNETPQPPGGGTSLPSSLAEESEEEELGVLYGGGGGGGGHLGDRVPETKGGVGRGQIPQTDSASSSQRGGGRAAPAEPKKTPTGFVTDAAALGSAAHRAKQPNQERKLSRDGSNSQRDVKQGLGSVFL